MIILRKQSRYYNISAEQREFGLKNFIAKQFRNSAARDLKAMRKGQEDLNQLMIDRRGRYTNHEIEVKGKLKDRAKELDTYVHTNPRLRSSNEDITNLKEKGIVPNEFLSRVNNDFITPDINDYSNFIIHNPATGNAGLAHEIGHSVNRSTPKGKKREDKLFDSFNDSENLTSASDTILSPKKIYKKYKDAKNIIKTEASASKNGLKEMKNAGATKEEIEEAKRFLKASGDTYRVLKTGWKRDAANYLNKKKKK